MEVTASTSELCASQASIIEPGSFSPQRHFYPRVLNAQIHPLVAFFLRLTNKRIVDRYCHLHPRVDPNVLAGLLAEPTRHLKWAGADLFCTTTAAGNRKLVVLETNSCPSGNKSMPPLSDDSEQAGYHSVIERAFVPSLRKRGAIDGGLAVLFDKNYTEASGYAAVIADVMDEPVYLTPCLDGSEDSPTRFVHGVLEVRLPGGEWTQVRAAFRYVTQRPWTRIPVRTRTRLLNPIAACLAGGRNKLVASKAYDLYNAELAETGLEVCTPETIADVAKAEVPMLVARFGGHAVVKIPYSNAGQGVFPILNTRELDAFMAAEHPYNRFVVQSLIGNYTWSSEQKAGRFYHVGTMPDRNGNIYVADLRVMVCSGPDGFRPIAVYARRAEAALPRNLDGLQSSWSFLGTNLSAKGRDGSWAAATDRLLLMDRKDFNKIGIGGDDLIEAYIQAVLSTKAIDEMAKRILTKKGDLRYKLFASLDEDATLVDEVRQGAEGAVHDVESQR